MFRTLLAIVIVTATAALANAAETLKVYGPGGPLPAMKEAAETFNKTSSAKVEIIGGPTSEWIEQAKTDADMVFSGSEKMMTDFVKAFEGRIESADVVPLYLRPSAILVRPGNPENIRGLKDLLQPGHRIVVVNGSGQDGLWEDVAGRLGEISSVRSLRANIVVFAGTSAEAKEAWLGDPSIDSWIIWNIWETANPDIADVVDIEPEYRIYRDTGIALTKSGKIKLEVAHFAAFLAGPEGARIFAKWGWITGSK